MSLISFTLNLHHSLILVKHAMPVIDPAVDAAEWALSTEGRVQAGKIAGRLAAYAPHLVVSSREPKAQATAAEIAERLDCPMETAPGLHEHDRRGAPFLESQAFRAAVAAFFDRPADLVFGNETADQAYTRFHGALTAVTGRHRSQDIVVVAHGTVITLFVAAATRMAPYPLWERLGLPSFVVLSRPEMSLLEVVENV